MRIAGHGRRVRRRRRGRPAGRRRVGATPLQDVDFAGGHGFTGLLYVDHEGAQLQVWCAAVTG
jgi:hypothetical protein